MSQAFELANTTFRMMNSIDELYPLLRFLRVGRYNDWRIFSQDIAKVSPPKCTPFQMLIILQPVKNSSAALRKQAMNRVQILLRTVMLRRQKSSEVDGKPILQLPAKHLSIDNVEFSDDEHAVYKALEEKSQVQFNKFLENDTISGETNPY
jgi:SNF2 family DNA or RNA helicase